MTSESNADVSTPSEPMARIEKPSNTAPRQSYFLSTMVPHRHNDLESCLTLKILKTTPSIASLITTLTRSRSPALSSTHGRLSLHGRSGSVRARNVSIEVGSAISEGRADQGSVHEDHKQDGLHASRKMNEAAHITQVILHHPGATSISAQDLNIQYTARTAIKETTSISRYTPEVSIDSRLSIHVPGRCLFGTSIHEETLEPHWDRYKSFETVSKEQAIECSSSRRDMERIVQSYPPLFCQEVIPSAHLGSDLPRPSPTYSSISVGASHSTKTPGHCNRTHSASRHSLDLQSNSGVDSFGVYDINTLNMPGHPNDAHLRSSVSEERALHNKQRTLDTHRTKAKNTNDTTAQYDYALSLIKATAEVEKVEQNGDSRKVNDATDSIAVDSRKNLLREARQILQRLSDRSHTSAQYYLADGYASGLFNGGQKDDNHAFPLFISASKHGHVEAGYRAALCYEFGWGCSKDIQKAIRYYRQSASRNHPGAMSRLGLLCLANDKGLSNRRREGVKWLRRAAESSDTQYNWAPYDLGVLYERGYADHVFQDEAYAVQLFMQSAKFGHAEANYRLGQAYELGDLGCSRNPSLSIRYYTGAARKGHRLAMMGLCAWYMVGAEAVLQKDEKNAYAWARKAAESGLAKAQYAIGCFTEMGIGCQSDLLEASVWYSKAAIQGDDMARRRLAAYQATVESERDFDPGKGVNTEGAKGHEGTRRKWSLLKALFTRSR